DRQSLLSRAGKIAEEIDKQSFLRTFSFGQQFDAVTVERLQLDLAPCRHDGIGGSGSMWHSGYVRRSAKPARVTLDVLIGFARVKKCRLLIAVGIEDRSVLRMKD